MNGLRVRRLLVLALPIAIVMPAAAISAPPVAATSAHEALQPGGVVRVDGISLVVPPRGEGVWGAALDVRGVWRSVGVRTDADGSVHVTRPQAGRSPSPPALPRGRVDPCTDGAFTLYSSTWGGRYLWWFNAVSTPSEITQDDATSALRAAVTNLTHAENDCGLPDNVSATASYKGNTTKTPNIGSNSSCLGSDGTNVVGFGDLASTTIGFACWWYVGNTTVEGDVKLNKTEYDWIVDLGQSCSLKWSVEAVATHELGHVFGLGDLNESLHPTLTMSLVIAACQDSEITLGLGDILGLQAKY